MMNAFDIMHKEVEVGTNKILLECANLELESTFNEDDEYMFESAKKGIIATVIDGIADIIRAVVDRIRKFFLGDKTQKLLTTAENNPDIKKKKGKILDFKKLRKTNDETLKKLKGAKSKEDVDKIMDAHRKKRKLILAGAGVIVSVSALLLFCKKGPKCAEEELKKSQNEVHEVLMIAQKNVENRMGLASKSTATAEREKRQAEAKAAAEKHQKEMKRQASEEYQANRDAVKQKSKELKEEKKRQQRQAALLKKQEEERRAAAVAESTMNSLKSATTEVFKNSADDMIRNFEDPVKVISQICRENGYKSVSINPGKNSPTINHLGNETVQEKIAKKANANPIPANVGSGKRRR